MAGIHQAAYGLYTKATTWLLPMGLQDLLLRTGKRMTGTRFVFLACFPKSGSTLLSESLNGLPGWRRLNSIPPDLTREQEPIREYVIRDWAAMGQNVVFKNHVSHSDHLIGLLAHFRMHRVFLVRNLADVCCSLSDHFDNEATDWPFLTLSGSQLNEIDRSGRRADFIVDLAIPWFVNCYASWMRFVSNGGECQVVRYEDLISDPAALVGRAIRAAGLSHSGDEINSAISRAENLPNRSRLNVGVSGRGRDFLMANPHVGESIRRYVSYYPDVDFSPVFE